jgi:hypothetical protein
VAQRFLKFPHEFLHHHYQPHNYVDLIIVLGVLPEADESADDTESGDSEVSIALGEVDGHHL